MGSLIIHWCHPFSRCILSCRTPKSTIYDFLILLETGVLEASVLMNCPQKSTSSRQHQQQPSPHWSPKIMHRHVTRVIALGRHGEPMACPITWSLLEYWCSPPLSPAVSFLLLPVLLLLSDIGRRRAGIFYRRLATMSSLLKPFSVCKGPCDSCGVGRGGCPSSAHQRQPTCRRLTATAAAAAAAATGLGSMPAHQRSYAAKRNLAAAAIGGRKITHPGKAILAGLFIFFPHNALICLADMPIQRSILRRAQRSLISICRPLKLAMQNWVKTQQQWCYEMQLHWICARKCHCAPFILFI